MLDFEINPNPELKMVAIDGSPQAPPNYHFSELVVHSLIHQDFVITQGSKLGKWRILSLENKAKFVPLKLPEHIMSKLIRKKAFLKTFSLRKDLSDSLSRLLLLKKNDIQTLTEGGLHDTQSKQLYVCSLMQTANVKEEYLPRDKNNKKTLQYNSLLNKLNSIILGQYFIGNNMTISAKDGDSGQ